MGDHGRRAAASRESGRRRWGELVVVELVVVVVVVGEGVRRLERNGEMGGKRETEVVLLAITLTALEQANDPCTPNTISICYTLPTIPNQVNPTTGDLPFFLFCAPPLCSFRPRRRRRRPTRPSPFFAHFTSIFATETSSDALCRCCLSHAGACGWCWWLHMVGRGEPPMDVHSVPVLRSLLPTPFQKPNFVAIARISHRDGPPIHVCISIFIFILLLFTFSFTASL